MTDTKYQSNDQQRVTAGNVFRSNVSRNAVSRNVVSRTALSTLTMFGLMMLALVSFSFTTGCEEDVLVIDDAPVAPQGVFTIRGDDTVFVFWLPVEAADFDHYNIYSAFDSSNGTTFSLIGSSLDESFVDTDVINGTRYFYAITAVDRAGNESLESAEYGGATPRFEGRGVVLLISNTNPANSGFNFASGSTVAFDSPAADIWVDRDGSGILYLNADSIPDPELGDVQDMGFTGSLDEIGSAPLDGWSALGFSELIVGHTYIIWTQDDRYAKVRIRDVSLSFVIFDYAYQSGTAIAGGGGEPELVAPNGDIIDVSEFDRSTGEHRTDHSVRPKQKNVSVVQ